jgi:hypothetical protein
MYERGGQLVAKDGWMTDAYSMDIRVVVPRQPAEVNITTASETLQLWHESNGHQEERHVRKLLERKEINMSMAETGGYCEGCDLGNGLWKTFTLRSDRTQDVDGLIHADVNGPVSVKSFQGAKYYLCFKEDYS